MYVTRFELATFWSVARRSIQLSYDPKILIYKLFTNKTTRMGFEPTTSAVTGRRSNQLSHRAKIIQIEWTFRDLNLRQRG